MIADGGQADGDRERRGDDAVWVDGLKKRFIEALYGLGRGGYFWVLGSVAGSPSPDVSAHGCISNKVCLQGGGG